MISLSVALVLLVIGYFTYGWVVEKVFTPDANLKTPAVAHPDGVDYVPMPTWKVVLIQFMNIAGTGPIFGAIMGAKFGVSSYLWIVFGSIFAGAVHDYFTGMLSVRNEGANLPYLHGKYLGGGMRWLSSIFTVVLLISLGAVFTSGPAALLDNLVGGFTGYSNMYLWIILIFVYYAVATFLPIDKVIGRFYPLFALAMLVMAVGIGLMLFIHQPDLPEVWEGLGNTHPGKESMPIFPMMFVSIACGAISGFHGTQSPLMARCMTNEKQGRLIFYGAMLAEGVVALIWAAAAIHYYDANGMGVSNAAIIVNEVSRSWMGKFGAILAVLGVVAAPITSGDTSLRSARLVMSDLFHLSQRSVTNRLILCLPLFFITLVVLIFSTEYADGFNVLWCYFSWFNQIIAAVTLWSISVYLRREHKCFYIALLPAMFMTMVSFTYILYSQQGLKMPYGWSLGVSLFMTLWLCSLFFFFTSDNERQQIRDNQYHKFRIHKMPKV